MAGPHRAAPLEAVDDEVSADGSTVAAGKEVRADDPYLAGHYPEFTVYPGVFTVESAVQAVERYLAGRGGDDLAMRLTELPRVRFRRPVLPGATLRISATCATDGSTVTCVDGADRLVATMRLTLEPTAPAPPSSLPPLGSLLPHRHPILLVDRVVSWQPPDRLVAVKAVTRSEPCYAGADLADDYPPTLVLESFAQSCCVLWRLSGAGSSGTVPVLGAVSDVVFQSPVYAGDVMRHVVHLDTTTSTAARLSGETWVDDRRVATYGTLTVALSTVSELVASASGSPATTP
jgi:3-hydroxymyristoyl/3-hydroxydecanoyl-(acyl carrier protein) dehydratase